MGYCCAYAHGCPHAQHSVHHFWRPTTVQFGPPIQEEFWAADSCEVPEGHKHRDFTHRPSTSKPLSPEVPGWQPLTRRQRDEAHNQLKRAIMRPICTFHKPLRSWRRADDVDEEEQCISMVQPLYWTDRCGRNWNSPPAGGKREASPYPQPIPATNADSRAGWARTATSPSVDDAYDGTTTILG